MRMLFPFVLLTCTNKSLIPSLFLRFNVGRERIFVELASLEADVKLDAIVKIVINIH